jgi:hypothetical protein
MAEELIAGTGLRAESPHELKIPKKAVELAVPAHGRQQALELGLHVAQQRDRPLAKRRQPSPAAAANATLDRRPFRPTRARLRK